MFMDEHHLIGDIYDAAVDGSLWPKVTAGVAGICEAEKVMMSATDILNPSYNLAIPHNITPRNIDVWRNEGYAAIELKVQNEWMSHFTLGEPSNSDDYFGGPEGYHKVAGRYYEMLERDHIRRQIIARFEGSDFRFSGIGLNNYDPFPEHSLPTLARLTPHLRRALEIHRQLCVVKSENDHLYRMLDALATGVVLIGSNERICFTNPSAISQIRQHGGIDVRRETFRASDSDGNQALQRLIASAIRTSQRDGLGNGGGVLGLPAESGNHLTLSVVPLSARSAYRELQSDKVAAAIFMTEANARHRIPEKALADLYRLTPREIRICSGFVNTPDLDSLAPEQGLTLGSLRTALKSIYQKTGQGSQAELMRLLMEMKLDFRHL